MTLDELIHEVGDHSPDGDPLDLLAAGDGGRGPSRRAGGPSRRPLRRPRPRRGRDVGRDRPQPGCLQAGRAEAVRRGRAGDGPLHEPGHGGGAQGPERRPRPGSPRGVEPAPAPRAARGVGGYAGRALEAAGAADRVRTATEAALPATGPAAASTRRTPRGCAPCCRSPPASRCGSGTATSAPSISSWRCSRPAPSRATTCSRVSGSPDPRSRPGPGRPSRSNGPDPASEGVASAQRPGPTVGVVQRSGTAPRPAPAPSAERRRLEPPEPPRRPRPLPAAVVPGVQRGRALGVRREHAGRLDAVGQLLEQVAGRPGIRSRCSAASVSRSRRA